MSAPQTHRPGSLPCVVCGSLNKLPHSTPIDYISGERFSLVRCGSCGLVYVDPQPAVEDLGQYYPAGHQQAEPASYELTDARARMRLVEDAVGRIRGSAMDVGCGKGLLLKELQARGWDVAGTELSSVSSAYARSIGLPVKTCSVQEAGFEPGSFDLITLFHVLEHLTDPGGVLASLHVLLKADGVLIVEVPNIASWYARAFGDEWFHLDVPRHLYHFDRNTLTTLIERKGFCIERIDTRNLQYDAFGVVQSALNKVLDSPNLLNNFNTKQLRFADIWRSGKRARLLGQLAFSELALGIGFPLFAAVSLLTPPSIEGGVLRVIARKRG